MFAFNKANRLGIVGKCFLMIGGTLMAVRPAWAGEAATSASAGSNGSRQGTASATATYTGDGRGFTQTSSRSGPISIGRGIAYGVDQNGITFSASHAVASRFGPAVASTLNITISRDGSVAHSTGLSIAEGDRTRVAQAGGFAGASRTSGATAGATAGGHTGVRGLVRATTASRTTPPRFFRR